MGVETDQPPGCDRMVVDRRERVVHARVGGQSSAARERLHAESIVMRTARRTRAEVRLGPRGVGYLYATFRHLSGADSGHAWGDVGHHPVDECAAGSIRIINDDRDRSRGGRKAAPPQRWRDADPVTGVGARDLLAVTESVTADRDHARQ
jgi:hypothetical protein